MGKRDAAQKAVKSSLQFVDKDAVLQLLTKEPLGSSQVDATPVVAALAPNLSFGPFDELVLNLRTAFSVQALNSPDDLDEDGVARPPASSGITPPEGEALSLSPQLVLTPNGDAWLKYRLDSGLKAGGHGGLSVLAFDFEGEASAQLADYRRHGRDERVLDAVRSDLEKGPRFAFSLDDVNELAPGNGLLVRLQGQLKASVTVSWSDVFTTHVGDMLSLTGIKTPVALSVAAGASLTGSLSLLDDFIVVFTRVDDARWRVAVRKAKRSALGMGATLGVTVSFSDASGIEGLINSYLEGLLGGPLAKVKAVLDRASLDDLSTSEREIVSRLLDRFGLTEAPEILARLKESVASLEKKAREDVQRVARAKLEAGFAYEYNRVRTNDVLFQATLTKSGLSTHHGDLVWGRLAGALADKSPAVSLERYLGEQKTKRTASWGFTLGIDKWEVGGMDDRSLEMVDRERRDPTTLRTSVQRSYLGARGYTAQWLGRTWSWDVDFNAEMNTFSADTKPKVLEFEFGLSMTWRQRGKHLSEEDGNQLIDAARLWRAVDDSGAELVRAALTGALDKPYSATVQLIVGKGAFRAIHRSLADPSDPDAPHIAAAMAAAMPWWKKNREFTPEQRRAAYEGLWAYYFAHPDRQQAFGALADLAARHLRSQPGLEGLGNLETQYLNLRAFTFAGLIELNRNTADSYERFRRGLQSLLRAIEIGEYDEKDRIPKIFGDLCSFWAQSHHVRALGAHLLDAARRKGVLPDVKRSLTIVPDNHDAVVVASA